MNKKNLTQQWFENLRDKICKKFEEIDGVGKFEFKPWTRENGGGGVMAVMKGKVFEKVGVNVSTVFGQFSPEFAKEIPGTEHGNEFFATGISLVAHMCSPFVPPVHMNTRFVETGKNWFGGGADLNPIFNNDQDTKKFHQAFENACDKFNPQYYEKFKKWADDYFFIKHRNEPRGIGGIFYDYLNTGNFEEDFEFTKQVGLAFLNIYPEIVLDNMDKTWTDEDREQQLLKRGKYAEFNLVYDRGTKFGFMTGGNTEAILMSLPPIAKWN